MPGSASRHVNYLGKITQSVAIALATGYCPMPYVALMLTRQADDDKVCRARYGALWERYTAKVRYRIVPRVY